MEDSNDPRLVEWLKAQEKIQKKQKRKQVGKQKILSQIIAMSTGVRRRTLKDSLVEVEEKEDKYEFVTENNSWERAFDLKYKKKGGLYYKMLVNTKRFQANRKDRVLITDVNAEEDLDIAAVEICHNGSDWRELYFYNLI